MKSPKHRHGEQITLELPAINIPERNIKKTSGLRTVGAGVLMLALGVGSFIGLKETLNEDRLQPEINRDEIVNTWHGKFGYGEGGIAALRDTLEDNGINPDELHVGLVYEGQELQKLFGGTPQAGEEFLVHQMEDGDLRFEKNDS